MIYATNGRGSIIVTSRKRAVKFGLQEIAPYAESHDLAGKINGAVECKVIENAGMVPRRLLRAYWREVKRINQEVK